jgi:Fe-S-cluster formation regulator IscX/YfhJ
MSDSQKKILDMLAKKKISVEEAERLLSLVGSGEGESAKSGGSSRPKGDAKYLRFVIQPNPGAEDDAEVGRVNVRVPVTLIRAGIKFTSLIPDDVSGKVNEALREKGIDFDFRKVKEEDLEELLEALSDLEVDVQKGKEKVHVYVE